MSITSTTDPQAKNDLYDSKEKVDPLMEDPFADRPDSPTDESVYTASESPEIPQKPLGHGHWIRQLSAATRKNLEQSGSVYRSALYYKARQPKPAELGPVGPAANKPNPLELLPMTKTVFISGRIARVHQKNLPLEPQSWKEALKHLYKAGWIQTAKVEW